MAIDDFSEKLFKIDDFTNLKQSVFFQLKELNQEIPKLNETERLVERHDNKDNIKQDKIKLKL